MKISGGAKLARALALMATRLNTANTLGVGFLENAVYPDGKLVAMIAAIQNWGAPSRGIPARPFFSNMITKRRGGWPEAIALNLKLAKYDAEKALARVGEGIAGQLRQEIDDTFTPPNAPSTIRAKGHSKPLVGGKPGTGYAGGHMRASVDYEVDGRRSK